MVGKCLGNTLNALMRFTHELVRSARSRKTVSSSAEIDQTFGLVALERSQWPARILAVQQRLQASGSRSG
jgi:hypothetical protein